MRGRYYNLRIFYLKGIINAANSDSKRRNDMKNITLNLGKVLFAIILMTITISVETFGQKQGSFSKNFNAALYHEKTLTGTSQALGDGKIYSWVKFNHDNLMSIGVTFDEAALKNLPAEPPAGQEGVEYMLALPKEAATTVFKHIGVNWNPHGHGPAKIYDVGHFDFHFYLISSDERKTITGKGDDLAKANKPLSADFIPEGYILAPDSVIPGMGAHWADPNSHEFHGHGFTKTFLYGSYDGKINFLEPMITKAFLETKPNVSEAIKLPAKYQKAGFYPTKYSIRYDADKKEYTIALEEMVLR
jgi:hypothetical protein